MSIAPPFIASISAGPALKTVYWTWVPCAFRNFSNSPSWIATRAGAWVTLAKKPMRTTGAVASLGAAEALALGLGVGVGVGVAAWAATGSTATLSAVAASTARLVNLFIITFRNGKWLRTGWNYS